ncbi:MAG TPA: DUF4097 family beta strand repeat-containing protein [Gammaproteobacteria bacterium]|jgi:DUF4097 and DUF4098 domain-containing protein YvlB|nr:DUF4097 family beta strand repeat-containing protein [Gammaproteobacteria bacterium]
MSIRPSTLLCLAALAGLAAGPAFASPSAEKTDTYKNPAIKAGGSLALTNLLGHVDLVAASDGVLSVDSKIEAAAGSDADAQALAAKIKIETDVSGNNVTLRAKYPLDEYDEYFYNDKRHENFIGIGTSNTSTTYDGERVRINSGTFGSGVNLHVDFVVHVPKGVHVTVDNKVGMIEASGVDAPLTLESSSGDIKASKDSDRLSANTGSGDVTVEDQAGPIEMDSGSGDLTVTRQKGGDIAIKTGSGDVKLFNVTGGVRGRTGSGDVELRDYAGSGADMETGSGDITLDNASGSLNLRAGSGDIRGTSLKSTTVIETHTGSGDVTLSGDLGDLVRLTADTGSGDIMIKTSRVPSLHIEATSESGDLDVDLPGMNNASSRHHEFRGDVNGGKGSAELDAGSGDVTFTKD